MNEPLMDNVVDHVAAITDWCRLDKVMLAEACQALYLLSTSTANFENINQCALLIGKTFLGHQPGHCAHAKKLAQAFVEKQLQERRDRLKKDGNGAY